MFKLGTDNSLDVHNTCRKVTQDQYQLMQNMIKTQLMRIVLGHSFLGFQRRSTLLLQKSFGNKMQAWLTEGLRNVI